MSDQHFFLGDKWLGSRKIPTNADFGEGFRVQNSYALFCPHCAAIWGKIMHEHPQAYCQPLSSSCIKHASFWSDATFTASEALPGWGREWNDDLPLDVKRYDILALTTFWHNNPDKRWMTAHLS